MPEQPSTTFARTKVVVRIVVPMLGGVKIIGAENIPTEGPVILAPNHRANIDPPYLTLLTNRQQFYMAKEELFKVPIFGPFIAKLGAFPVKRGEADRAALRAAMEHLKKGRILVIFPEGTRSPDGNLGEAEKGFALIAKQTGAPIVPVAIEGTEHVLPRGAKFVHRASVTIKIGQPITAAEILAQDPRAGKDALAAIGEYVMSAIGALISGSKKESENYAEKA